MLRIQYERRPLRCAHIYYERHCIMYEKYLFMKKRINAPKITHNHERREEKKWHASNFVCKSIQNTVLPNKKSDVRVTSTSINAHRNAFVPLSLWRVRSLFFMFNNFVFPFLYGAAHKKTRPVFPIAIGVFFLLYMISHLNNSVHLHHSLLWIEPIGMRWLSYQRLSDSHFWLDALCVFFFITHSLSLSLSQLI